MRRVGVFGLGIEMKCCWGSERLTLFKDGDGGADQTD